MQTGIDEASSQFGRRQPGRVVSILHRRLAVTGEKRRGEQTKCCGGADAPIFLVYADLILNVRLKAPMRISPNNREWRQRIPRVK
jgi:hypothetical protein